jgi:ferredoxin-NADP reductase
VYSARDPASILYSDELAKRSGAGNGFQADYVFTRTTPPRWPLPPGRISAGALAAAGWLPAQAPAVFVCGPTGFVEAAADVLVDAGHDPGLIKTERFGPTGGQ